MSLVVPGTDATKAPAGLPHDPGFLRRLTRQRVAIACLAYLAFVGVVALLAPILLPDVSRQEAGDLLNVGSGPSSDHWLGTDTLGRDVLERLAVGTRTTLVGVLEAVVVIVALGLPLGLVAGYFRGRFDRAIMWVGDALLSLPGIVVVLVTLSVFRNSMLAAMVTFGVLVSPSLMRVVRSAVLPIREELSVDAAKASGLSNRYILTRHILPRVAGPAIVQTSVLAATGLIVQTGLSFLGLLIKAPEPSWGGMIADGVTVIIQQPWLIWPPGVAIALTILALALLGDGVRDALVGGWSSAGGTPAGVQRTRRAAPVSAPRPSSALLSVQGLRVTFTLPSGEKVDVVEGVDFEVMPGETVGIVGESGCGKTQTALSIIGLLARGGEITGGSVVFDGTDVAALAERQLQEVRGKEIGLISQEPMVAFDPTFTVGSQIAEVVRKHRGISRRAAREVAIDLLRQVNLPDPLGAYDRYPHELSGGMAQRAVIARALAGEPKLLIADEPTTALDVTVQAEILDLLRTLQRDRGMAILLITHDWGVVADMCDRAVVMYAGQVIEQAPLEAVFGDPRHPYTSALLAANPHGATRARALPTIPGSVPPPGRRPHACYFHDRCAVVSEDCRSHPIPLLAVGDGHETRCIHPERVGAER